MDPTKLAVWLDDKRPMPYDFGWDCDERVAVQTAAEAIKLLQTRRVDLISLDHDLGDETKTGNGYQVACFIENGAEDGSLPRLRWAVHSQNPVGSFNMRLALACADKFWNDRAI